MSNYSLETFVEEPTLQVINGLKKSHLLEVANYYKLEMNNSQRKSEIKQLVIDHLIDEEIIPEDKVEQTSVVNVTDDNTLELRRLEMQDREKERECQLRLKELKVLEKELAMQLRLKEVEVPKSSKTFAEPQFDISKQIRFVLPFQEKEVDKYFLHFEKIATSLDWTLLFQSVLIGKAHEVYSSMSVEQSAQYELVKITIIRHTNWCPSRTINTFLVVKRKKHRLLQSLLERKKLRVHGIGSYTRLQQASPNHSIRRV